MFDMKFDVEVVKKCLVDCGEVYTVRSYKSFDRFRVVDVDGVDHLCERLNKVASIDDLLNYSHLSGFRSPLDWWNKIIGFNAQNGYMYHVSVL